MNPRETERTKDGTKWIVRMAGSPSLQIFKLTAGEREYLDWLEQKRAAEGKK